MDSVVDLRVAEKTSVRQSNLFAKSNVKNSLKIIGGVAWRLVNRASSQKIASRGDGARDVSGV